MRPQGILTAYVLANIPWVATETEVKIMET